MKELAQTFQYKGDPNGSTPQDFTLTGPLSAANFGNFKIGDVVNRAMTYIFLFAGVGLLVMLLMGGFELLTSSGDPKKMQAGTQKLTWGLVGFIIVFIAYWMTQVAQVIFKVNFGF